nr:hypothetical protein [Tanacetum cinerariifolium]
MDNANPPPTSNRPVLLAALRAQAFQELYELIRISVFVDSHLESIERFLNNFANQPNETNMNDLEFDDESVDTPLVSPFPYSDNDSDDGEVLNELIEQLHLHAEFMVLEDLREFIQINKAKVVIVLSSDLTNKITCRKFLMKNKEEFFTVLGDGVGIKPDGVFSTWVAFGGNTRDLDSFREETDKITDLHQIHEEVLFTERGDGVAGIKRCRRNLSSDSIKDLAMASRHGQLKEDLESSTWRRHQDFNTTLLQRYLYIYKIEFRDLSV